jgi:hypothetical protein
MGALEKIRDAGFDVLLDGDAFEISPASKLTQQQRAFLKSHKAEIIDELLSEVLIRDRFDDRRFCRECQSLINGRCTTQQFRPVDDVPRRCSDFYEKL